MSDDLTRAEARCLRLSFERNKSMPQYPESIWIAHDVSRAITVESLRTKGYLLWTPHRGSTYTFTAKARQFVGAPS